MKRTTRWMLAVAASAGMLGAIVPVAQSATSGPRTSAMAEATAEPAVAVAADASASLPSVETGSLPGPPVLYEDAPAAPQLENRHPAFVAPFDRVSGTDRYVGGEYLYTDHLYDDSGDGLTYPTAGRFGDNAADLVEFRISTRADDVTHYRFTLNTLLAEDTTRVAVAFDTDEDPATGSAVIPGDPGAPFPGSDAVLSAWGTGARWSTWNGSAWDDADLDTVGVDLEANQITVAVPTTVVEPTGSWQATLAVGLHDADTGGFLAPQDSATEDQPGGGADKAAIFNLGFRFDEAILSSSAPPDEDQSAALADGEPTRFSRVIDFDALADGASATTVPDTGTMVRFFPSRLQTGEGRDDDAFPALLGQLQAYSLYVPTDWEAPFKLTLNLHSLGERHWQYNGSTGVQQLGQDRGSLVATADARGEDGWYQNEAEYDVFEMWNDVARHFALDPDATAITGYSMGGYATYRLGTLYPDLFGAAVSVVGPPGDGIWLGVGAPTGGAETLSNLWLENARNVPYMNIVAAADELVPISGTTQQNVGPAQNGRTSFDALGYRYAFDVYPAAEHLTLAILGYDLPQAAEFMGEATVDRDPFHVTHAYTPAADDADLGLVHDHAYWVSDVALADPAVGVSVSAREDPVGKGVVDAESLAFGIDDPASIQGGGAGTVPLPYTEVNRTWEEPPVRDAVNGFELTLTNIASVTLDLTRARVTSAEAIELHHDSDGPATVTLVDAEGRSVAVDVPDGTGMVVVEPFGSGGGGPGSGDGQRCEPELDEEPQDRGCRQNEGDDGDGEVTEPLTPSDVVYQPTVEGPIGDEGIRTGEPFFTTLLPLPGGWVEEEFFYEGIARTAEEFAAGEEGDTPFKSRIMVRRPTDPADFNGTVILDWNNVTVPQDRDVAWHPLYTTLIERGYAYVSVAAQRLSIEASPLALKQYDPVRYGSLSHPGDDYSYDIFSQAAEAVLGETPAGPVLGELRPHATHRLAMGASQSGGRLKSYINSVQQHAGVFDGFQPQISSPDDVRRDLVPIIWVNSGNEADDVDETPPDSDLFRLWEIAGTAHTSHGSSSYMADNLVWNHSNGMSGPKEEAHDLEDSGAWGYQLDPGECVRANYSLAGLAWSAALVALDDWVRTGDDPAPMPRLARDENGRRYDEHDNMLGGIRLPYLDVPIATYYGGDVPDGNMDPCGTVGGSMSLSGYTRVFSAAKLAELYPSADAFVEQFDAAVDDALAAGFILPEGAADLKDRARRATAMLERADALPTIPGGS